MGFKDHYRMAPDAAVFYEHIQCMFGLYRLSLGARNPVFGFATWQSSNQPAQLRRLVRILIFHLQHIKWFYFQESE